MATESQKDKLNRLFKEAGLLPEDVHKHQHYTILRRSGIEKIAAKHQIRLTYKLVKVLPDFAVVKATAKTGKGTSLVTVETYGSAAPATSQNKYYVEMAEKRAKSRAVLQITDLYQEGVYGEDEADDFSRAANPEPTAALKKAQPEVEVLGPVSETQTPSEVVEEKAEVVAPSGDEMPSEAQLQELLRWMNHPLIEGKEKNHLLINLKRLKASGVAAEQTRIKALITQRENERSGPDLPATTSIVPASEQQISALIKLIASPLLDAEERSMLLSMPVDHRPAAWVETTLTKLTAVLETRQDPKKAMEAARAQLRTAAAKYANQMPESAYNALVARAKAITAKPEELRAEARAVHAQFQAEAVAA